VDAHRKYSRKHSVVAMQEYLRVDFQRKSLLLCGFHIRFESKQDYLPSGKNLCHLVIDFLNTNTIRFTKLKISTP
jgi:hypothetical protein